MSDDPADAVASPSAGGHVNVADLLATAADGHADKVAVVEPGRRVTYAALDQQATAVGTGLALLGLAAGQRVAIAMANRSEFVAAYLGSVRAGMVAVPLNTVSTSVEIARVLADSGARVCVCDDSAVEAVREAVAELEGEGAAAVPRVVVHGADAGPGELSYAELVAAAAPVVSPRDPEWIATLMYTSGTSGSPRAAMLSHRALLANVEQAASTDPPPLVFDDVVLGVVPMSHVYGLNAVLGQVLRHAATVVLGPRFDPDETLRLIEAEGVTVVPVAPPVIAAWRQRDDVAERLSSVRTLLSGAAPLAEEVVRAFEAGTGVDVEQGYGLTEAAPIVTTTLGTPAHKPGSAGRAVPGVELRVVDELGRDVEHDDPGEILVRGANLFSGYWPDGDDAPDAGGWLATGDIGFLDADGDLFLVDRLKELVIVSGFNVYPSEIEDVVLDVEGVRECAVIGVDDPQSGESVVAYVVASDPDADPAALAEEVLGFCRQRLARFKVPSAVEVVTELPHSATGKVAKGRLRAAASRHSLGLS